MFMLDQSGSVGEDNHDIAIQFIQNVVSFFSIGLNATRVGFVAYSTNAHVEFLLDDHTTLPQLQNAISNIDYRGGWTATAIALNFTRILLNPASPYGARPNSDGIPKIGILLTGMQRAQATVHMKFKACLGLPSISVPGSMSLVHYNMFNTLHSLLICTLALPLS